MPFIYNNHHFVVKRYAAPYITENPGGDKGTGGEVGEYVPALYFRWWRWEFEVADMRGRDRVPIGNDGNEGVGGNTFIYVRVCFVTVVSSAARVGDGSLVRGWCTTIY